MAKMPFRYGIACAVLCTVVAGGLERPAAQAPTRSTAVESRRASGESRRVNVGSIIGNKTVIRQSTMVRRVDEVTKDAVLRPDEFIVARWAKADVETKPITPGTAKAWSVGFGFIGITREGQEIRFRPIIESTGGLIVAKNGFQGRIFVGLRDNRDPSASYRLPQPVSLLVGGQADDVAPRQLTIDHTNLPFEEVTIAAQNPPDSIDFSLIAAGTSERATVSLQVIRPRLELSLARSRIQGLGLETTAVNVRAVGLPNPEGRVVTVTSEFASIDPSQVTLDSQGTGRATVRSVSFGRDTLRAASPPLTSATARVGFSWPFAFLIAAIAGGVAGALLARVQRSGLPKKKSLVNVLVRGVLTGIIVVALYAIGVNVLPIQPIATAGEVLAFAVAAAGGFLGLKL